MIFRRSIVLLFFASLCGLASAQAFWSEEFPNVRMHDVEFAVNGDLLCSAYLFETDGTRQMILRLDPQGNLLWAKKVSRQTISGGFQNADISEAVDGTLYVLTYADSASSKRSVLHLSGGGDFLWARTYNRPIVDMALTDNGVVTLGGNYFGLTVQRIDSLGNNIWNKSFSGNSQDTPTGRNILWASSGIYVVGYQPYNGWTHEEAYIMRLDDQGNVAWQYSYANPTYLLSFFDLRELSDGSLMVESFVNDTPVVKPPNMGLVRLDTNGNEIWHQMYLGTTYPQDLEVTCDDRIMMVVNDTVQCFWKYVYMFEVDTGKTIHNLRWVPEMRDLRVAMDDQCNLVSLGTASLNLDDMTVSRNPIQGGFGCEGPWSTQITPVSLYDTRTPVNHYLSTPSQPISDTLDLLPFIPVSSILCDSCVVDAGFEHQVNGPLLILNDTSTGYGNAWLWTFGDGQSSSQQNPSHTYAGSGAYTVCLKVWEGNCIDSVCTQVNVPVAIDPAAKSSFDVYPNPARNAFRIAWETEGLARVEVLDLQGKTMGQWEAEESLLIKVPDWPAGLYFVRFSQDNRSEVRKLRLE